MKSKHCFKHFAAALACLMLCLLCMPHAAFAQDYGYAYSILPVEGTPCSIELSYKVDGEPVEGIEYKLYRVATMDKNVQLELTEKFKGLQPLQADGMDLKDLPRSLNTTWMKLAETLYQNLGDMEPDATATTVEDGTVWAKDLEMGLWLVVGDEHTVGTAEDGTEIHYRPVPFLVALPSWVMNNETGKYDWAYNVSVASKPMLSLTARRVIKAWSGGGNTYPVTVQLMRNGEDYGAPVELNRGNNWSHDFVNLEQNDGTDPIKWTIRETTSLSANYTVSISEQGVTFVVTNTYNPPYQPGPDPVPTPSPDPSSSPSPDPSPSPTPDVEIPPPDVPQIDLPPIEIDDPDVPLGDPPEEIDDPPVPLGDLPQTGQLWWPVPVLAVVGVIMFLFGLKRRSGANDEK